MYLILYISRIHPPPCVFYVLYTYRACACFVFYVLYRVSSRRDKAATFVIITPAPPAYEPPICRVSARRRHVFVCVDALCRCQVACACAPIVFIYYFIHRQAQRTNSSSIFICSINRLMQAAYVGLAVNRDVPVEPLAFNQVPHLRREVHHTLACVR